MKSMCWIAVIIGFFIFYQQNPLYAIIVIAVIAFGYLYVKSRRSGSKKGFLGFMKGSSMQENSNMDDVITIMMLQQLFNNSNGKHHNDSNNIIEREYEIEKVKQEVLELLDD
ncbi:MAG: UbiA family prenyltransferase [Promethearchaeota archaeon]|jgi:hypothetical protein